MMEFIANIAFYAIVSVYLMSLFFHLWVFSLVFRLFGVPAPAVVDY
jgi:hypothetical protein